MKINNGTKVYHIKYGDGEVARIDNDIIWIWFWRIPNYINDGVIPFEKANIKDKVPNNWERCGIMERVDIDKVVFLEQFTLVFKTIEVYE
jgi:hypothetical protein